MIPNLPETHNDFTNITAVPPFYAHIRPSPSILLPQLSQPKKGGGDLKSIATEETPLLRSTHWNSFLHFDFIYSVSPCITPRDARRVFYH